MEEKIIENAKTLIFEQGKSIHDAILQAIEECGNREELNDIYRLYDISKYDYIKYIKRKIEGEL